jgi:hypothetical protein
MNQVQLGMNNYMSANVAKSGLPSFYSKEATSGGQF